MRSQVVVRANRQEHGVKRSTLSPEARQAKRDKDRAKIAHYRALVSEALEGARQALYTPRALELTTQVLELNPELYSVWNYRRHVLQRLFEDARFGRRAALEFDLKLGMSFLKRYPKCYWVWNHRKWCLHELASLGEVNWGYEMAIVAKLLEYDARNFHGWQYRRFVVENMEAAATAAAADDAAAAAAAALEITHREYRFTTTKINSNISNFLAWHNRTKLIPRLYRLWHAHPQARAHYPDLAVFDTPYSILMHDLDLIKTGMYMDADDTSVWLYLRWLLTDAFFVDSLDTGTYHDILRQQLAVVTELNELEIEDDPDGRDNVWCLKSIFLIGQLLAAAGDAEPDRAILAKLAQLDPLRRGRYLDQAAAAAAASARTN